MRAVLLIAANFLREQRWLTMVLVLYAIGMAAVFGLSERHIPIEDAVFFLRQQSLYAPLFSLFLGVSAINNERKSRRILAVLSKALTRRQYIAGLLVGILAVVGVYCLAIAVAGTWLTHGAHASVQRLWILLAMIAVTSALLAAVAMFFSTFLTPVFAALATGLAVAVPAALAHVLGAGWQSLLPVYSLAMQVLGTTLMKSADWRPVAIAIVETLLFWTLASWIFAGRDITTAVE